MSVFSFNKSGLRSDDDIETLYENKIRLFIGKRKKENLPERDKKVLKLLEEARLFDPRYKSVFYPTEKMAKKAVEIAEKLDSLTDEKFLISSYPYMWRKEINMSRTGKLVSKEAADALSGIVQDDNFWKEK